MQPHFLKLFSLWVLCIITALYVGVSLADGDYRSLLLAALICAAAIGVVRGDYHFLLVFGLLCPFTPPLGFVSKLPILLPMLSMCFGTLVLERSVSKKRPMGSWREVMSPLVLIIFAWVLARYLTKPVFPNMQGGGDDVTGFRGYLAWALSFGVMLMVGLFLRDRSDVTRLFRIMGWFSVIFAVLFIPLVFTRSELVATILRAFGMFVANFDNGWLRFVILPNFGLILISVGLLPDLVGGGLARYRKPFIALGMIAVALSGSRSSVLIAVMVVAVLLFLKGLRKQVASFVVAVALMAVALNLLAERLIVMGGNVAFLRVAALFNPRVAEATDAQANVAWRMARWELAMQDITERPWFGRGYGGLENALIWGTRHQQDQAMAEIDVASGAVHNGYLASAWAFGIPFVAMVGGLVLSRIWISGRVAMQLRSKDPLLADFHAYTCANMSGLLLGVYIGADMSSPMLWLLLSLSIVATRYTRASLRIVEEFQAERSFAGGKLVGVNLEKKHLGEITAS